MQVSPQRIVTKRVYPCNQHPKNRILSVSQLFCLLVITPVLTMKSCWGVCMCVCACTPYKRNHTICSIYVWLLVIFMKFINIGCIVVVYTFLVLHVFPYVSILNLSILIFDEHFSSSQYMALLISVIMSIFIHIVW